MSHRLRPLAAMVLGGTLALATPGAARDLIVIDGPTKVQDLECVGCVQRPNIRSKAVSKSKIKNKAVTSGKIAGGAVGTGEIEDGAVTAGKLAPDVLGFLEPTRSDFYITLDGDGTEKTIATNGPLTYFARCLQDVQGEGLQDVILIVATSSDYGWFEEGQSDSSRGNEPFSAESQVIVASRNAQAGAARYGQLEETSIVAPDGSYLGLEGDAGGLGLNIFGHDCIAVGTSYSITGDVGTQIGGP